MTSPSDSGRGSADAILDAARDLFMASGFDGVNLDQVGKAAGVSRQTVYNQFGSKDAVFRAMVTRYWGAITAELERASARVLEADDDPGTMLRRLAEVLYRLVGTDEQVALARLVVAESRRAPWIGEEFYLAGKHPLVDAVGKAIAAMNEKGRLRCEQPEFAARQFIGLLAEFGFWPRVMASGPASLPAPSQEVVTDEAIAMFMARYGGRA